MCILFCWLLLIEGNRSGSTLFPKEDILICWLLSIEGNRSGSTLFPKEDILFYWLLLIEGNRSGSTLFPKEDILICWLLSIEGNRSGLHCFQKRISYRILKKKNSCVLILGNLGQIWLSKFDFPLPVFISDRMALVRHFVRSTVCLRTVLRHTDITRHLNCSVKRIEQQLLCAPALPSWSVFRTYATKKSKGQKKEKGRCI